MTARLERIAPIAVGVFLLLLWQSAVEWNEVPPYVLPSPLLIAETLVSDFPTLLPSWLFTIKITVLAFLGAAIGGLALSLLLTSSRLLERSLFPYAVILQVTPIVAIAPLIIIWAKNTTLALLICAWIVAFFPVVSNTMTGLNSTDFEPSRPVQAVRGLQVANDGLAAAPISAALFSGGVAHLGRPRPDWRRCRRIRRRNGRRRIRARLSHSRIRLQASHPAGVRGACAHFRDGACDFRAPVFYQQPAAATLARQRVVMIHSKRLDGLCDLRENPALIDL